MRHNSGRLSIRTTQASRGVRTLNAAEAHEIAARYAPVFARKVSREWKPADQVAPVDFAGSYKRLADNPLELERLSQQDPDSLIDAKVYYSVCENSTHYYLL